MLTKTISDIQAQQAAQIFAILDTLPEGVDVNLFRRYDGRLGVRVTKQRGVEHTVSGSSARDALAQACQVLP